MKIQELLIKIKNEEIKDGRIFHGGDFFWKLIVIDKKLYLINELSKSLVLFDSDDIGSCLKNDYDFYEYKKVLE